MDFWNAFIRGKCYVMRDFFRPRLILPNTKCEIFKSFSFFEKLTSFFKNNFPGKLCWQNDHKYTMMWLKMGKFDVGEYIVVYHRYFINTCQFLYKFCGKTLKNSGRSQISWQINLESFAEIIPGNLGKFDKIYIFTVRPAFLRL